MRVLDRIHIARGFTANQHFELVRRLPKHVDEDTSLVVCPMLDHLYRDAEAYADEDQDQHLTRLDRYDRDQHSPMTQQRVPDHSREFLGGIDHLHQILDRIGRRIDAKRNSANSRMVLAASMGALSILVLSFIGQLLF